MQIYEPDIREGVKMTFLFPETEKTAYKSM
jgi:hypothetical protein